MQHQHKMRLSTRCRAGNSRRGCFADRELFAQVTRKTHPIQRHAFSALCGPVDVVVLDYSDPEKCRHKSIALSGNEENITNIIRITYRSRKRFVGDVNRGIKSHGLLVERICETTDASGILTQNQNSK